MALAESLMRGQYIFTQSPSIPGARDYRVLTEALGSPGFFG